MKLSVETYVLVKRYGEEKAFRLIKEAGFDSVDYSFYWPSEDLSKEFFGEGYINHAIKTRKMLDEIGLTCNQAHAPFDVKHATEAMDMTNKNYANIVKSIEAASILGTENIVVHAIYPGDGNDIRVPEVNYEFYKSLEPYLEKFKMHIAIENLFGAPYDDEKKIYTNNRFDRPEKMNDLLDRLDSEWFGCCIDVGHAAITGIDPQDYIRRMDNKRLRALHIHDNDYERDRHMLPYTGKINWREVAKSLREINYNGELTFEIVQYLEKFDDEVMPDALKFAERIGRYIISMIENCDTL